MSSSESIVLTWEERKASRAAKRELLAKLGLGAPSRRKSAIGSQEKRLARPSTGAAPLISLASDATTVARQSHLRTAWSECDRSMQV